MKSLSKKEIENLSPFIILFAVITLFVFITSFTVFYTTENFSSVCGCRLPLWVILVSLSSFGLFIGLLVFYMITTSFLEENKGKEVNIAKILDIIEGDDSKVLKILIDNKGVINQSNLTKALGYDRVKVSRILSKMERGGVIRKEKEGMTNKIILSENLIKFNK